MKVCDDVLAVLSRAETNGQALLLQGHLDRKMYERTNKVLEAAGGKWNKKAKAHLFDGDAAERVDQIILSGEVEIPKDEFEFFPTPPEIVARVVDLADVGSNMRVLEPSAGKGNLIAPFKGIAFIDCIEKMAANAQHLRDLGWLDSVMEADFLEVEPSQTYDRVVMNPPFSKQADIKHALHALKFLKPDGKLTAIMSFGVVFRDNKLTQDFRELIRQRGGDIEALPDGAFKSSGTMVRTVIVTM